MDIQVTRVLRTPHSERFLLSRQAKDFAALDLHYLVNGSVAGTVVLFEGEDASEAAVTELLKHLDEVLLPEVALDKKNLSFTVVVGKVLGSFVPSFEGQG